MNIDLASISEVSKGIESLYLSEPVVDGYTTNQAAPAGTSASFDLIHLSHI